MNNFRGIINKFIKSSLFYIFILWYTIFNSFENLFSMELEVVKVYDSYSMLLTKIEINAFSI